MGRGKKIKDVPLSLKINVSGNGGKKLSMGDKISKKYYTAGKLSLSKVRI